MLLSELVDRLQAEVPAEDGVPSEEQYERAVKDAILDFSERCGRIKSATIQITPGNDTYDLPADFLSLISMPSLYSPGLDAVLHTMEGLVPLSSPLLSNPLAYPEQYLIQGLNIVFVPTPSYTISRVIRYKAAWISTPDDYDEEFGTIGEREARIILLKAASIAMNKLSKYQAGNVIDYSFGAVSEKLDGGSSTTKGAADLADSEYLDACRRYNGQYASYGD
jgi:hypothetical protein